MGMAIVGQAHVTTKTMTKEARPLTQEQRKEFVQLLKDAKARVLGDFSNRSYKRRTKAWDAAIAALLGELGAKALHEKAAAAKKELKDSEKALRNLGFQFDDKGNLELTSEGSDRYEDQLSERRDALMDDEVETARKAYEMAILNVLATESVEEAKGIVEPLV